MRIGLAWISRDPLTAITVRYERYVQGLRALGHEVLTVCLASTTAGYEYPTIEADDVEQFKDPNFWKRLDFDIVIVISWMTFPDILEAIKAGSGRVIAITDSDGIIGARAHPRELLPRMIVQHSSIVAKLGAAKHWCQLFFREYIKADEVRLRSASASDRLVVNSPGAQANLTKFFLSRKRLDLCERVAVVPYPVDEEFLLTPNESLIKANRVVAIGRWDDPQKDAELLTNGIKAAIAKLPQTQFLIVGRNGESSFGELCARHSNAQYLGVQTRSQIAELMRTSRSLVISSRWESGPIVANEALCLGCSLVGPRWIPAVEWYCNSGPHGTLFHKRSPHLLADALFAEMKAWESRQRNAVEIATTFRRQFASDNVCQLLLHTPPQLDRSRL